MKYTVYDQPFPTYRNDTERKERKNGKMKDILLNLLSSGFAERICFESSINCSHFPHQAISILSTYKNETRTKNKKHCHLVVGETPFISLAYNHSVRAKN